MSTFTVNGQIINSTKDVNLLTFLRKELKIKSVKDGCSEGACGTCSVLIDNISRRSCIFNIQKLEGKTITTVEGLTDYEKEVFAYCFAKAGAVQCGFCIPGMVISAKALLDKNLDPSEKEIRKALKGNICRCTGYVKIIEAIFLAAEFFRERKTVPRLKTAGKILEDVFRVDAYDKTLGKGEFVDDIEIEGMVYASALRSQFPRAVLLSLDATEALKHTDCIRIITADDIPGSVKSGHIKQDWDCLIPVGKTTHYIGDALCLVVSEKEESLNKIKSLIKVEYDVKEPVTSPQMALKPDAPLVHESNESNVLSFDLVKKGKDVDAVISASEYVVSNTYQTPFTEHAFMEPECAIGFMLGDVVNLYTASQNIFDEQREVGHILGLPPERIHIKSKLVGGGFGGKEDMVVQHHAALATYITKLPVKVKLSRQESINIHPKRHAMTIEMTTACDKNGILTGIKTKIIADTGAYASLGGPVIQRACTHAPGPYQYKSVYIEGTAVYTNNPPAGAFRGFGVTQSNFAAESNLTALAHKVGITPWEIRYRNAIVPGGILPNGQIADKTTAYKECLSRVKEIYDSNKNVGIAGAFKNTGIGVGLRDVGRCIVSVENGNIHIRTGAARIGQGLDTVALQIAAETLELEDVNIVIEPPNTVRTPNSGTTTASRQTLFTGEAITQACLTLKETLKNSTLEALEGQEFYGEYSCKTDPITTEKENPYSHVAYSYGVQLVILNDVGTLKKVHACYDVGQVINPRNVQGQIEGGVVMGLGYALTENYPVKDCIPQVSYGKLGLFRVDKTPEITVDLVEIPYKSELAYGAKGIGEIACIPTAAATSGAYYMLDGEHRTKLPLAHTAYRKQG